MSTNITKTKAAIFRFNVIVLMEHIVKRSTLQLNFNEVYNDMYEWLKECVKSNQSVKKSRREFESLFSIKKMYIIDADGEEVPLARANGVLGLDGYLDAFNRTDDYMKLSYFDPSIYKKYIKRHKHLLKIEETHLLTEENKRLVKPKLEEEPNYKTYRVLVDKPRETIYVKALNDSDLRSILKLEYGKTKRSVISAVNTHNGVGVKIDLRPMTMYSVQVIAKGVRVSIRLRILTSTKENMIEKELEKIVEKSYRGAKIESFYKCSKYEGLYVGGVRECRAPRLKHTGNRSKIGHIKYKIGF